MDDLKKLSVERLRELARKHLGKGHSRLRTRAQLLLALKEVLREPLSRLLDAAESVVPPAKRKVRVVDFPPGRKGRVRTAPQPAPGTATPARAGAMAAAAGVRTAPPEGRGASPAAKGVSARGTRGGSPSAARATRRGEATSAARGPTAETAALRRAAGAEVTPAPPRLDTGTDTAPLRRAAAVKPAPLEAPVEEGFFEVPAVPRRPRRAATPVQPPEREPFASPREAGTDAPLLLVRDPTTLFVFWDFRRELERGAALGLREPKLLLRLYRGPDLDRSLELALAVRSTYVTGLTPGQEYSAEVLLLGRDGWTRPVGSRSAVRRLPPGRVSAQLEVRTLRLPWSEPLSGAPAPSPPSAPRHEPLDSPRRVPLPTSPGARGPGGGPGPSGGPRSGRN
ncbi:MAG TPA: DUF4912 domain-containing protein [Myxococcaceae bacterium]|nr:DUF4912 domain-containing protein [Myxococcaceae bacterium]